MTEESRIQCQRFTHSWVECYRAQPPMLGQLYDFATSAMKSRPNEPGGGGKPKSCPPFDMGVLDLHARCTAVVGEALAHTYTEVEYDGTELNRLYHEARILLGYEAPVMLLPSVVCHACGGPLIVASDASSAVTCAERCGVEYPTHTWLDLLTTRMES